MELKDKQKLAETLIAPLELETVYMKPVDDRYYYAVYLTEDEIHFLVGLMHDHMEHSS